MRAFASGLRQLGVGVKVLVLLARRPRAWSSANSDARGEWRGVTFEYMSGLARGQRWWIQRRLGELRAVRRTVTEILNTGRSGRPAVVILVATNLRWILPVFAACRLARVPLVHDRTEFPFVYAPEAGPFGRLWRRWYVARVFRLFDGVVVISTHLEQFMRPRVRPDAWVLRIPILVDADTFACADSGSSGLVGYAGSLGHPEELSQLVEATAQVRKRHRDARLRIIGGGNASELQAVRYVAERNGMEEAIELPGFARAGEMPELLCGCAVLALPRAAGLFSTAGMPTKLGEYLATGRPVVVTATGDIPRYLHDQVEAFVVEPGDVDALARALERALYDDASEEIGRAGQRLARSEFDPATHMGRLLVMIAETRGGARA